MQHLSRWLNLRIAIAAGISLLPFVTPAQHYTQTNLVSNLPGVAPQQDANLQNAWGLVSSPTGSPWWVSNNQDGTSTVYAISSTASGLAATLVPINPAPNEFVAIPFAPGQTPPATAGSPTGVMFNGSATDFLLAPGKPALFIFVTEDGTIQGWNPGVNRASAVIVADHSQVPNAAKGAVYKGAQSRRCTATNSFWLPTFVAAGSMCSTRTSSRFA